MTDRQMFKKSLANHPGVLVAAMLQAMTILAVLSRNDIGQFSTAGFAGLVVISGWAWVPVLITAWTGRATYEEETQ